MARKEGVGLKRRETEIGFRRILIEDVIEARSRNALANSQASRRELVRTTFAAIDGISWAYRETISSAAKNLGLLTIDEDAALSETTWQVSDSGKLTNQTRFIQMLSAIRLATRIALRIDAAIEVDFNGHGWQKMQSAQKIRNRVTHPKKSADLDITPADLETCAAAFDWLVEADLGVCERTNAAMATYVNQIREILTALKAGNPSVVHEYEAARRLLLDD